MAAEMQVTNVYTRLAHAYFVKKGMYNGYVLSGGSRSSKTFSIVQFIITYCQKNANKRKDILIAREQYSDLKKTVLKDFIDILHLYGIYKDECHTKSNPQAYKLYGNMIYFSGLDTGGSHGEAHDVVWINEAFEASIDTFNQLEQRLREFFILDYNPCFTEHWIKDAILKRKNVFTFRSSWEDNRFLGQNEITKLLSYDPNNPVNVANGTADDYMYKVYTLGFGAQLMGIIIRNVTWITEDEFPKDIDYWYGLDLGFVSDPTAMVKTAIDGNNLYVQEKCYEPIDTPEGVSMMMDGIGIERYVPIIADSADKYISAKTGAVEMVKDLKNLGWNIDKVIKSNNIVYWLGKLNEFKIHIVRTKNFQAEIQNYRWRTINGIQVNQPIDKWNHLIDGTRYSLMASLLGNKDAFW